MTIRYRRIGCVTVLRYSHPLITILWLNRFHIASIIDTVVRKLKYIESVFASRLELRREGAIVLTDAYAPLDAWSDDAVQAMRY